MNIDAVITWVDSSDKAWRHKINQYLEKKIDWNNKKKSTRYNSINEIEICITSILKFATFIKNIYVVTDNQKPDNFEKLQAKALTQNVNLQVIDHKTIFNNYEQYLPTFNSQTIETMLYKIPNLSEHFVYFNDDMFLINETKPSDFFINKYPVLRGKWLKYDEDIFHKKILNANKKKRIFNHRYVKEDTAKMLGFQNYFNIHHTPYPLRKSTIQLFFEQNPKLLENNIKYRFRHKNQFLLQVLANHIEIKKKTCILIKELSLFYTHKYTWYKILKKTIKIDLKGDKKKFLCLQSLETINKRKLQYLLKWIDKKIDSNFANEL